MTQLTIGDKKILAVEVPEMFTGCTVYGNKAGQSYLSAWHRLLKEPSLMIDLPDLVPPGNWQIIARCLEFTEEQAKEILDPYKIYAVYKDYAFNDNGFLSKALDSWQSFCRANKLTTELILIQQQ